MVSLRGLMMYSVLMQMIGSLFGEDENSHWAFQSIIDHQVPVVQDNGWSKNEIDAFIFDKLNLLSMLSVEIIARNRQRTF